jgi:hypothetical protein
MIHEILEEQVEAHTRLLGLSKAKQEALVAGNVGALEQIVASETAILRTLGGLELRYSEECAQLGRANALRPGEVQDRLGQLLDGPAAVWAVAALERLADLTRQLAFTVQANGQMIRWARAYVDFSLGQLARMGSGPMYDHSGAAPPLPREAIPVSLSRQV